MAAGHLRPRVDPRTHSAPALKAFFKLAQAWTLSVDEAMVLLGSPPRSTFFHWKKGNGRLSLDTLERVSYLLGIYKALHVLLPDDGAADAWVRRPNDAPLFAGKSALDRMLSGHVSDLFVVRQYLDAERGGKA